MYINTFKLLLFVFGIILFSSFSFAQENKVTEAEVKVSGICEMCKSRIEKAVRIKEVKFAKWNKSTKTLKLAFLTPAITLDSIMQRVAAAGHDNEKHKAPDEAYAKLHSCCLYREGQKTH
ncbi:MAG: heavy-metal-associated domain-containing protein [Bacillota bacterium]